MTRKCDMCGKTTDKEFKRYYWKGDTSMRNIFIDENGEKSHELCPTCFEHEDAYSRKWAKSLEIYEQDVRNNGN